MCSRSVCCGALRARALCKSTRGTCALRHTKERLISLIMVYDSQYTKDACTAPPHVPKPVKNRTAIVVCQRALQAAADKRVLVRWVKVKGHSNEEGNDIADKLADYAQKGGAQNEHAA